MSELFDVFPYLENEKIIIRKMTEDDVDALSLITNNENVFKYVPYLLHKKSKKYLSTAIKNLGTRDFDKKKLIIAGVYLKENPDTLIGMAEIFDYKKRADKVTIGYKLNESYWHQGIATNIIKLVKEYLSNDIGINCIQAFVMPENIYSGKALLRNNFKKEDYLVQEKNWGGQEIVDVEVYTYKNE